MLRGRNPANTAKPTGITRVYGGWGCIEVKLDSVFCAFPCRCGRTRLAESRHVYISLIGRNIGNKPVHLGLAVESYEVLMIVTEGHH